MLVEIIYNTADENWDYATFVLELALEASHSSFACYQGGVLLLCLPPRPSPEAEPPYPSSLFPHALFPLSWKAACYFFQSLFLHGLRCGQIVLVCALTE